MRKIRTILSLSTLGVLSGVAIFGLASPAGAATTTPAQLTLTGLVSSQTPTGGSSLTVKPGTSVTLTPRIASLGGIKLPGNDYEVYLHLPKSFPGASAGKTLELGGCSPEKSFTATFAKLGSYSFSWEAHQATISPIFGLCQVNPLALNLSTLSLPKTVKLASSSTWSATVKVSTDKPKVSVGVQLPTVKVSPPKITLPTKLPTIPVGKPTPSPSGTSSSSGSTTVAPPRHITPPKSTKYHIPRCIPCEVVPSGEGGVQPLGVAEPSATPGSGASPSASPTPTVSFGAGGPSTSTQGSDAHAKLTLPSAEPKVTALNPAAAKSVSPPRLLAILAIVLLGTVTSAALWLRRPSRKG